MTVALLFSPQGSQSVGMGRELAAVSGRRGVFEEADAAARLGGIASRVGWARGAAERHATDAALPGGHLHRVPARAARRLDGSGESSPRLRRRPFGRRVRSAGRRRRALVADALAPGRPPGRAHGRCARDGGMAAVIGLDREAVADVVAALAGPPTWWSRTTMPPARSSSAVRQMPCWRRGAAARRRRTTLDRAQGVRAVPLAAHGRHRCRAGRGHRNGGLARCRAAGGQQRHGRAGDATPPRSGPCSPSRCIPRSNGSDRSDAWRTRASTPSWSAVPATP